MKKSSDLFAGLLAATLALSAVAPVSCNKISMESVKGRLKWSYSDLIPTRSTIDLPDTDAFKLTITDAAGAVLYDGLYGDSPESLLVDAGSYTVKVVSRSFDAPEFSAPQFGDEQVAVVQAGSDTKVELNCTQLNSGLRFRFSPDFKKTYPEGSLTVSSARGSLVYSSGEDRIGYFSPGSVSVSLNEGSSSTKLMTRFLEAREILSLGISCPSGGGESSGQPGRITISIDTLRYWNSEDYVIGSGQGDPDGSSAARAYSVPQAKEHIGEKGVWIRGYIVGGDLSSSADGISCEGPFESATNIAIASRSSVTDKQSCLAVQLAAGDIRNALNLVDNPKLLGSLVYLKGEIVGSYFGVEGIKNVTECSIGEID